LCFLCLCCNDNALTPAATSIAKTRTNKQEQSTQQQEDAGPQTSGKSIDAAGAGATWMSPGWLTQLNMLWGGKGVRGAFETTVAVACCCCLGR
jgi:hypothetical protein